MSGSPNIHAPGFDLENTVVTDHEWQEEMERGAARFHVMGMWAAIFVNPLFSINDYINIPEGWVAVLVVRSGVTVGSIVALVLYKKGKISTYRMVATAFILISLQNCFTYLLIESDQLLGHNLNYLALFMGAALFAVWPKRYSAFAMGLSLAAAALFIMLNTGLNMQRFMVDGGLLLCVGAVFTVMMINARFQLRKKEIIARLALNRSLETTATQKRQIEESNEKLANLYVKLTDSIQYARRIQRSILPADSTIKRHLPKSFIFFRPKDIVSGDFYWFEQHGHITHIAAVDCTGHGVPGALMSMIGNNTLNQIVRESPDIGPDKVLDQLNDVVSNSFRKTRDGRSFKDGMNISLCRIDHLNKVLQFAGAYQPLYIVREGKVVQVKGDKFPIGVMHNQSKMNFSVQQVNILPGDVFYIFSDGYPDQFGGPKNKKFMYGRFRELLLSIHKAPMKEQKSDLLKTLKKWKGNRSQIDDILVIGFKI